VVHELEIRTSGCELALFKSDDKSKSRDSGNGRNTIRVRQIALAAPTRGSQNSGFKGQGRRDDPVP